MNGMRMALAGTLTALILVGCAGPDEEAASLPQAGSTVAESRPGEEASPTVPHPYLAGTAWRLVEIQSMDDAIGTRRPPDSSAFTMHLNADGTVNLVLDCNRANGSWSANPSADPTNGSFTFGPLAGTRALCPPPNLDEEITAQAQYIRGYLLRDSKLYLSLMADGGIWVWEPLTEVGYLTEPDSDLEEAIREASPDYTREMVELGGGSGLARYVYGRVDLNGDGQDEVLAYLLGSIFCGTGGCDLLLFSRAAEGYRLLNTFPISRLPIIVAPSGTSGWRDLYKLESGGGAPPSIVRLAWDGSRYVEEARLPGDAEVEGMRYLAGELTFDLGIPLEPRG